MCGHFEVRGLVQIRCGTIWSDVLRCGPTPMQSLVIPLLSRFLHSHTEYRLLVCYQTNADYH